MRRLLVTLLLLSTIQAAQAACNYSPDLFDWTGRSPLRLNQRNEPVTFGANITGFYVALGYEKLYMRFETEELERMSEDLVYAFRLNVDSPNLEYIDVHLVCDQIIYLVENPRQGATINWTINPNLNNTINNNFEVAIHDDSFEVSILLDFLGNPTNSHFNMEIRSDYDTENDLWLDNWIDLCSLTGNVCGDSICEQGEDDRNDLCRYCPNDCAVTTACPIGEAITDWSGATVLGSDDSDNVWKDQESNGTDLIALKAKVDTDNLYLKIDLDQSHTPHENITYAIRIHPWTYDIDYIDIKLDCDGIYEFVEGRSEYVSPTNYSANPKWSDIKNNFTTSMTENSVEIVIPWYVIYYSQTFGLWTATFHGADEMNQISTNQINAISLFVSSCGDGICSKEENDSYNRYQFCSQDCPDASAPLCGDRICDEGEDDRWNKLQCVDDCLQEFGKEDYQEPFVRSPNGDVIGPLIAIAFVVALTLGAVTLFRRLFRRLTSGRRKKSDMRKRLNQIEEDKKNLQKKFMETRISESEFKEKMESLDREKQNLDLELKKK